MMTFKKECLEYLAGGNNKISLYGYSTKDTLKQTQQDDYFKKSNKLKSGDLVFIRSDDGNAMINVFEDDSKNLISTGFVKLS